MKFWGLLICLLLALEVAATRVFHRPLEEVLTPTTAVIRARVRQARVEITSSQLSVYIDLDEVRVLQGRGPATQPIVHSFSTVLEGEGVRESPIRDGSGIEQSLQPGQEYFFLLDPSGQFAVRAEPLTSEARVRALLR